MAVSTKNRRYNLPMLGDLVATIRSEWQAWKTAFDELPDNPLAKYFALMRKRRLAKLPWYRRNAILLVCLCIYVPFALYASAIFKINIGALGLSPQDEAILRYLEVIEGVVGVLGVVIFFWFVQTLFSSLFSALAFLSLPSNKGSSATVDDIVGISILTDRECGMALINQAYLQLIRPITALVCISQVSNILWAIRMDIVSVVNPTSGVLQTSPNNVYSAGGLYEEAIQVMLDLPGWKVQILTFPLDVAGLLISSLLGALLLIGLFIVLGRNLKYSAAIPITVILTIFWMYIVGSTDTTLPFDAKGEVPIFWQIGLIVFGSIVIPILCLSVLKNSLLKPASATSNVLIMLALFLPSILGMLVFAYNYLGGNPFISPGTLELQMRSMLLVAANWGSQVFSPQSPSSIMADQSWRWYVNTPADFPWHELLRAPMLILVQLLTLAGLSPILLKAISLRRQGHQ